VPVLFKNYMTIKEALEIVINESGNEYAKTYAIAGLELGDSCEGEIESNGGVIELKHKPTGKIMIGNEMKTQLLYVLSNLGSWRGDRAREIKKVLKGFSK